MLRRLAPLPLLLLVLLAIAPAPAQAVRPLPAQWQKGLNITAFWWSDLSGRAFRHWLRAAKDSAHADTAVFVVTWYQRYPDGSKRTDPVNATTLFPSYGSTRRCAHIGSSWRACKTPSMAALKAAILAAKGMGLKVVIRPQIDVGTSQASTVSRERIDLRGAARTAWFASYGQMLAQYGRLARDTKADGLVVGADLTGMTNEPEDLVHWRTLIDAVRTGALFEDGKGGFPGEMTYAMTWQAAQAEAQDPVVHRFVWDDLNAIGIDAYFPLIAQTAPHDDPPVSALVAGWAGPLATVQAIHAEYDKPVVFTGLGYLSRKGTSVAPGNSDAQQAKNGGTLSLTAQSRPVDAAFQVWSGLGGTSTGSWFQGIWWWEWPAAGRGGPRDGSYALEGKPSERVICRWHLGSASAACPVSKVA